MTSTRPPTFVLRYTNKDVCVVELRRAPTKREPLALHLMRYQTVRRAPDETVVFVGLVVDENVQGLGRDELLVDSVQVQSLDALAEEVDLGVLEEMIGREKGKE